MPEDAPDRTTVTDVYVKLAGQELEEEQLHGFVVDLDLNQPDMVVLTLKNSGHRFSNAVKNADPIEVFIGGSGGTAIFKGEVCGVEPQYKTGSESKCIVRGFNRLHRLLRGRKSRTFLDQSDQDIVSTIASDAGLSPQCDSEISITHEHVYQHNQTDLEFLRLRAARIGYEVWVDDRDLHFSPAKTDEDSGIALKLDAEEESETEVLLSSFNPRMSSAGVVSKVITRGWDPLKKEEIVGEAEVSGSKLGDKTGDSASSAFGSTVTYEVDHPIFSVEEAKAISASRLGELIMGYITGEGSCKGNPRIKPGIVVTVTINPDDEDDKFNGKYLVTGATHSYSHAKGSGGGGYKTAIRFARDAEGSGATTSDQSEEDA